MQVFKKIKIKKNYKIYKRSCNLHKNSIINSVYIKYMFLLWENLIPFSRSTSYSLYIRLLFVFFLFVQKSLLEYFRKRKKKKTKHGMYCEWFVCVCMCAVVEQDL